MTAPDVPLKNLRRLSERVRPPLGTAPIFKSIFPEHLVENSFNRKFVQKVAYGIAHACLADRDSPDGQKLLNYANDVARGEFPVGKAKASRKMMHVLNSVETAGSGGNVPAIARDASTSSKATIGNSLHRDALLSASPTSRLPLNAPVRGISR
jgi:hypothetical protein